MGFQVTADPGADILTVFHSVHLERAALPAVSARQRKVPAVPSGKANALRDLKFVYP